MCIFKYLSGFIASLTSHLYDSCIEFRYIDINVRSKQSDINVKNVTNWGQHCVILITIKTNNGFQRETQKGM